MSRYSLSSTETTQTLRCVVLHKNMYNTKKQQEWEKITTVFLYISYSSKKTLKNTHSMATMVLYQSIHWIWEMITV